jgi:hypothetical protein
MHGEKSRLGRMKDPASYRISQFATGNFFATPEKLNRNIRDSDWRRQIVPGISGMSS